MPVVFRYLIAVLPFALTAGFVWLVSGPLSLGGGEKDIFLSIPLLLWSFVFLVGYLLLWLRGARLARSIAVSAAIATVVVAVAWVVLLVAWPVASAA
ncbi:MAG: hypothetical protein COZ47_11635 [Lysobacterales bacterium CG_4_10_14_3_um_filter_64_11]|nr:MAG: hypothetical protein COZ47_11635 [Xanthomonadales bacterium CG_4_10_14_3_um_filter_64_11]